MKIFGSLGIPSVNLFIAAERTSRHVRRNRDAFAAPGKERIIAVVVNEAGYHLALGACAFLCPDLWRDSRGHIEDLEVRYLVAERHIHVPEKWLPYFNRAPVTALIVDRAQVVSFAVKGLAAKREATI